MLRDHRGQQGVDGPGVETERGACEAPALLAYVAELQTGAGPAPAARLLVDRRLRTRLPSRLGSAGHHGS